MTKKILFLSIILGFFEFVAAQDFDTNQRLEYTTQSRLIILRVVPKDKTAKIYLAGVPTATLNVKKDAKLISVTLLEGDHSKVLKVSSKGDFYEVGQLPMTRPYELKFETEVLGKSHPLNIKINPSKP